MAFKGEVNDGVVTKSSALRIRNSDLGDWPIDHAGEIGCKKSPLPIEFEPPQFLQPPHFARYDAIVELVCGPPAISSP
jgi:hypothetical protein